ncbi:ribosome maturation protein RimP [Sphingorhabdus arenilitoris]|uniref:Ribosome maturation factor RimP n=1 Tax=Sphingorhabdus arenilitoris TaxID=1490041 RepID=A0ABV8RGD2_9SPHN
MTEIDALIPLIEPEAKALGFALVRVKWLSGEDGLTLQIMAERPDTRQLVIEDCAALSRRISEKFDEADPIEEPYRLEVSSPGIDRPLTRLSDYADWAGHEASVKLASLVDGRKTLRGDILGVDGEDISIDDRKNGSTVFRMENVESAKLTLTDRLIASTAPVMSDGADEIEQDDTLEDEQED